MSITDFDAQYGGFGTPSISPFMPSGSTLDSGATAVTTTPKVITLTVPTVGGNQPTVKRGKLVISCYSMNGAAVLGQIDVTSSDGTHTINHGSIPAAVAATAGRGGVYVMDLFIDGNDTTTIATVAITIATSSNNNYTARCRFLGEMD
jgi:hypothetical protein